MPGGSVSKVLCGLEGVEWCLRRQTFVHVVWRNTLSAVKVGIPPVGA